MGNTCHCGHSRNCNTFWDNLMFGRCRCKRNDFHECCCKEKPKCECEKCHCKKKRNAIAFMKRKGINNKKEYDTELHPNC